MFIFVHFLFLLVSEVGCGLWSWHSLDFSINVFAEVCRQLKIIYPPPPTTVVYATDRYMAVSVLFLFCVGLWFILRGDSCFKVFPCPISSPRLGKRELVFVLLAHLFVLHVLVFVLFLILLVSGVGCGLWLWHSLSFSINVFKAFKCILMLICDF